MNEITYNDVDDIHSTIDRLYRVYPDIKIYDWSYDANTLVITLYIKDVKSLHLIPPTFGLWGFNILYLPHVRGQWQEVKKTKVTILRD